jgi:hypothetical protein
MASRARRVTTCPDCGGILQSMAPERLTSADVQREPDAGPPPPPRQCLICGYEERESDRDVAAAV